MSALDLNARWKVPGSWAWVRIGEVCEVVGGGTPSTRDVSNFEGGDIPWITPADLSGYSAKYIETGSRSITARGLEGSAARLLPAGTVLFSSRAPIGYVAIARNPVSTNQGFKSFVPPLGLSSEYLYYYLRYAKPLAVELSSGTTFQEISGKKAAQIPLAIAPRYEQERIVEKLEELLSDVDAGMAALERARANLKRYRAAVLKAAVEGRLTEKWRAAHPDAEPAEKLLERIRAERRKRWEDGQLAKYAEKGQSPPKGWKEKYPEPVNPDTSGLPELPAAWCWASWSQVGVSQNGRPFPSKEYCEAGIRLLRPGNFYATGAVSWNAKNTRYLPEKFADENPDLIVRGGELVINLTAQSLKDEFLGRTCTTSVDERCLLNQRLARLTPILISPRFMLWVFKSAYFRRFVADLNTGSLIQHMFTSQMDAFVFPIPPLPEQLAIIKAVEEQLSIVDHLEALIAARRRGGHVLRQAILRRAFEGKLVPQDPKDEPATELLARIRARRLVEGGGGRKGEARRGERGRGGEKQEV